NITRQIHADGKKRRSSYLVALLFTAGNLRRYVKNETRKISE
ncbi:MAG: hypothetical protein ACI909_003115, partial [Planctomycetota bacterium]